jgi:Mg2+ and Co2+ transporter CorA
MQDTPFPLADQHTRPGIVFAFHFDAEGRGSELPHNQAPQLDQAGVAFWWVHVNLADKRGCDWITSVPGLPEDAREMLLSSDTHDRIDIVGDVLAGVFVDIRLEFAQETDEVAELRFLLADRLLVTGRRHALSSIEATRAAVASGRPVSSALDLLEAIVDREADAVSRAATELGHSVDHIEDRVLEGYVRDVQGSIGAVRRRAVKLNRQLSRLHGLFRRVELAPAGRLPSDVREAAGRMAQRLESIHQELHASQDRARLLQDEVGAQLAAASNRQLNVLSKLTAVFLPATLVTGLFGMNTKGLPFADDEVGFWDASAVAFGAAMLVWLILMLVERRTGSRR